MKKLQLLLSLLAILIGVNYAQAETVSPYSVDFNTTISTSAHDFKVASGWGHIVSKYSDGYDDYYVSYTYRSADGVDGTGCLKIGSQSVGDEYGTHPVTDILVTPKVTGAASIYAEKTSYSGKLVFYEVTKNANGSYTLGAQLSEATNLNKETYTKIDLPTSTTGYVGIYGSSVFIDDFAAESAEVVKTAALTITNVSTTGIGSTTDADAQGNVTFKYNVTVKNTGDLDLKSGDTNYSLSIVNYSKSNAVVSTTPITQALAVGATSTPIEVTATYNISDYPDRNRYDVMENETGTTKFGAWIEPVAYKPIFSFCASDNNTALKSTDTQDFGMSTSAVTKSYNIRNTGAAPMSVTAITVPEGFTASVAAPQTVAAHGTLAVDITMTNAVYGAKSGNLVIKTDAENGELSLPLTGTVIDPALWYVNFEDNKIPADMIAESSDWKVASLPYSLKTSANSYWAENGNVEESKLISPLLKVAEGDKLVLDVAKRSDNSFVKVYYSADRKTWTLAKEIKAADMNTKDDGSYYGATYCPSQFTVDNIPAGNCYVAFGAGYAHIDNILGFRKVDVAHDWMVTKTNIPATGTVNHDYTATVDLRNALDKVEAAGSYTAKLYVDKKVVATATAAEIAAGGTNTYTFTCAPHAAGTFKAYVEFACDGYSVATDATDVTFAQEVATKDVQAGTANDLTKYTAPLYLYDKKSESETLYTPAVLTGLKNGDVISKITFKGYNKDKNFTSTVTAWIENTTDTEFPATFALHDKTAMTKIYDGSYSFTMGGTATDAADMLTFNLAQPFTYTGGSIRIILHSESNTYGKVYFEQDNTVTTQCMTRHADGTLPDTYTAANLPVAHFAVATDPSVISGTVTDTKNVALGGVSVKLVNGNVEYSGKTDDKGKYSVNVIQTDKTYDATYSVSGYADATTTGVSFAAGNVTLDKQLAITDRTFVIGDTATICLPIALDKDQAAAAGKFYSLYSFDGVKAKFGRVESTLANTPYVFVPATEQPFTGMDAYDTSNAPVNIGVGDLTFAGTFSRKHLVSSEVREFFGYSESTGSFVKVGSTGGAYVSPFRAYLYILSFAAKSINFSLDEDVTGITTVNADASVKADNVYTIDGQLVGKRADVKNLKKGLYIVNGKKVAIK